MKTSSSTLYSSLIITCIRMYLPSITLLTKNMPLYSVSSVSSFNHFSAIYCLLLERVMKRKALLQNWLKVRGHNPSATMLPLEDDLSTLEYTCSASATYQLETTGYQKSQPGDLKNREEDDQSTINPSLGFRKSQRHTPSNACASQNFSCLPSLKESL